MNSHGSDHINIPDFRNSRKLFCNLHTVMWLLPGRVDSHILMMTSHCYSKTPSFLLPVLWRRIGSMPLEIRKIPPECKILLCSGSWMLWIIYTSVHIWTAAPLVAEAPGREPLSNRRDLGKAWGWELVQVGEKVLTRLWRFWSVSDDLIPVRFSPTIMLVLTAAIKRPDLTVSLMFLWCLSQCSLMWLMFNFILFLNVPFELVFYCSRHAYKYMYRYILLLREVSE